MKQKAYYCSKHTLESIEKRLARLAKKTGRTKTFYAREAILAYLEDMEDIYHEIEERQRRRKFLIVVGLPLKKTCFSF